MGDKCYTVTLHWLLKNIKLFVLYLICCFSLLKLLTQAPSLAQYGPCLPHTSLSLIHHVTASRHNDGLSSVSWRTPPFFSLQSPGERLFPLSSLSTWPFPSCPSGLPQRSHVVTAQFKFPWHPLPFLHSTLLSYNSEIIRLISTSTLGLPWWLRG